ncbi:type-2 ice-structuring protein-like [Macrobrachium nipponense]|uniref:type-2 ice-structuring protein-like n=1 Tax=Macrobrachium nipponense TaxID=159736 RepID=UPI0030C887F8
MKIPVLLLAVLVSSASSSLEVSTGTASTATPTTTSSTATTTAPTAPTTERPPTPPPISTSTESACQQPFEKIGGQCLLVENFSVGTYKGMTQFCDMFGARIAKIPDADSLYHIADYLYSNQLTTVSFWIGATDEAAEGSWTWEDGSRVLMGTPFWANYGCLNKQSPDGVEEENCAVLDKDLHFYFNDVPCDSDFGVICEVEW